MAREDVHDIDYSEHEVKAVSWQKRAGGSSFCFTQLLQN